MKITVRSSKSVKPASSSGGGSGTPTSSSNLIPLTVFDEANHDEYVPGIFAFHPPTPPFAAMEAGLAKMLAEYRHCTSLLAWGQAVRGVAFYPAPVHDRASLFVPRDPPLVEFEHRGAEFKPRAEKKKALDVLDDDDEVVMQTVRFSREFVARLKSEASAGRRRRPYSAAQCVAAHLWWCVTAARRLDAHEVTKLHIAVNGRGRLTNPTLPKEYTGNAVLWARPATTARDLLHSPLQRAAELISKAVSRVDGRYFRSFVDFASSGAVEREGLVRTAVSSELVARTNIEVDSVLGIPFYDLDFGTGKPLLFMPTYSTPYPVEGAAFLVPAASGDGGVVAYVPLYRRAVDAFASCVYSLPPAPELVDARL